jgi:hypothetical protein
MMRNVIETHHDGAKVVDRVIQPGGGHRKTGVSSDLVTRASRVLVLPEAHLRRSSECGEHRMRSWHG